MKKFTMEEKNVKDIKTIIKQLREGKLGESADIEFKRSTDKLPKSFWETYSSFSNTFGGYIILGVTENADGIKISGVSGASKIIKDMCNTANNSDKVSYNNIDNKNINTAPIGDKEIIIIYIPELPMHKKPLYLDGKIGKTYIRRNEGDYIATAEDIRRFLRNAHGDLDSELLSDYSMEDLNQDSILRFKNIIHTRKPSAHYLEMDNLEFLTQMGVFQIDRDDHRRPKLTVAGLLFLGKLDAIAQKFPHFHLDYINKREIQPGERWKDRVCSGDLEYMEMNLFEYFLIVSEKLRATITDPFALDDKSIRKTPVELSTALREALANMIIHADYFDPETELKVIVEDLDYVFINPGMMLVSDLQFFTGGKSLPRNNTLIQFFRRMGISDRAGTGGKEIYDMAQRNQYQQPELKHDLASTALKIWVGTPTPAQLYPNISSDACKILECLGFESELSSSDIQAETGLSTYFLHKALDELKKNGLIIVHGKGRATKYNRHISIIEQVNAVDEFKDILLRKNRSRH